MAKLSSGWSPLQLHWKNKNCVGPKIHKTWNKTWNGTRRCVFWDLDWVLGSRLALGSRRRRRKTVFFFWRRKGATALLRFATTTKSEFFAKKTRRYRLFGLVLHSSSNMVKKFLYSLFFISPKTSTCRGSSASLLLVLYSRAWFGFRNMFRFRVVYEWIAEVFLWRKSVLLCERKEWEKKTPHTCHIYVWRKKTQLNWKKGVLCLFGWLVGWCLWVCLWQQLFFSYFKELVGKVVTVELKNDLAITGILHSVDQYLNIKLEDTRVVDEAKYPHMVRTFSSKSRVFVVRPLFFFFFLFRLCFVIF